jgi:hypothetical protein
VSDIGARDDDRGRLFLTDVGPECVEVSFQPSWQAYAKFRRKADESEDREPRGPIYEAFQRVVSRIPSCQLAKFDKAKGAISTYPIVTRPSGRFLQPKYPQIIEIVFEDLEFDLPDDELEEIHELPDGFIQKIKWGLGFRKVFRPIIDGNQ